MSGRAKKFVGGLSISREVDVGVIEPGIIRRVKENRPMKYILLIYGNEKVWGEATKEQAAKMYEAFAAYGKEMREKAVVLGGAELQPISTATSVKFANGKTRTVDGPFAETKETLGGYYVIDVPNLEEAIYWAEKMPTMVDGTVEIRPLGASSSAS
jgi:hypothetical protein